MARKNPRKSPDDKPSRRANASARDFEDEVDVEPEPTPSNDVDGPDLEDETLEERIMDEPQADGTWRVSRLDDPYELAQEQIDQRLAQSVTYYAGRLDEIQQRLERLEREWNLDEAVEASGAAVMMLSAAMAMIGPRRWLLMTLLAAGGTLQYALTGRCPGLWMLRRMGVRRAEEIDQERFALKALRGDFAQVPAKGDMSQRAELAIAAARLDGQG